MLIKIIEGSHSYKSGGVNYCLKKGDEKDVPAKSAKTLIDGGYAKPVAVEPAIEK